MTTTPVRTLGYVAAAWCIGFAGVSAWQLAAGPIGQSATGQRYAASASASGLAIMGVLVGLLKLAGAAVALAAVLVGAGTAAPAAAASGVAMWGPSGCWPSGSTAAITCGGRRRWPGWPESEPSGWFHVGPAG